MKLFVNTVTKECGMYDPSDLEDGNWIEAPKGTQAVYYNKAYRTLMYYKFQDGILKICTDNVWTDSILLVGDIVRSNAVIHLWGTLPDFEF